MWLNVILGLGTVSTTGTAEVLPKGKVARIGMLLGVSSEFAGPYIATFRSKLYELGYMEGQIIAPSYAAVTRSTRPKR